ncbi:MAG TPA: PKD domain-containing protein [Methanoregulaceae archaeon]|nr:PKD domain-containing protein [Methanoregulaceae archaeon]
MKFIAVTIPALLILVVLIAGCTNQPGGSQPVTSAPQTPVPVTTTTRVYPTTLPTLPVSVVITVPIPTQSPPVNRGNGPIPNAQFTANPVFGNVPLKVSFTDLTTGSPDNWTWDFGDGNTSYEQNPVYVYTNPGTFTVRLVASNNAGSNSETKSYYIMANAAFHSPGAGWDAIPPTATQPTTVEFLDRSSGPPTSWYWDFGDGGTSTLQNPVHTYSGPGVYLVSLNVSNEAGFGVASGYVSV